tara:strand:+ start:378 stop:635 length:258 start_codon:yes stop_codon:yes gene_type:complete
MNDATARIQHRKDKLLKAATIIKKYLDCPDEIKGAKISNEVLLQVAAREECMVETAALINDVLGWLDDESYYDELAWELEGKPHL